MLTPLRACFLLAVVWLLPISEIAEARGPRGGGRAVSGFSRGGPGAGVAPGNRISAPAAGVRGGQFTPSAGQAFGERFNPAGAQSPADVQQFLSGRQGVQQPQYRNGQWATGAQSAVQNFQNGPEPFSPAWYAEHPTAWQYTHPHADAVAVASAAAVTGWIAYGAYPAPAATTSTTIVYESADSQTDNAATTEPPPSDQPTVGAPEWLTLGVYQLSPSAAAEPTQMVRLSVAQSGELRGVYFDHLTGSTQNVTGRVDAHSQQAVWSLESNPSVRFAATLTDLTRASGSVVVSLPSGDQTWALTRSGG